MRLSAKKGFTLIELLIVVVIIGILAAIAIPKFSNTKEKAYLATMKADLRNLATAQEAYFADSAKFFSGTADNTSGSGAALAGVYSPSKGVKVVVTYTSGPDWSAVATMNGTDKQCDVWVGSAPGGAIAKTEGAPDCGAATP